MARARSPAALAAIAILTAVAAAGGLIWTLRSRGQPEAASPATGDPRGVFADEPLTDCRTMVLPPPGAEVNTVLDYYSGTLAISFWDSTLGADRVAYIRYEDPSCRQRPALRNIIDGALGVHTRNIADMCRSTAEVVRAREHAATRPGGDPHSADLEAARRFLERWCR